MRPLDVVRAAVAALARHKLRSALAMLGIAIGAAGFIACVAVGQGASRQIQEQISSLGENLIWIEAGGRNINGVRTGTHGTKSLTLADARAIEQQIPGIANVTPNVDTRVTVVFRDQNWSTQVRGVSPQFLDARGWRVERGRFFSREEVDSAAKVCALGHTVVENLFGPDDPVDQSIRVQKIPCQVIGVLDAKGSSPAGQDQDDVIIMPFTTVQKKIKGTYWLDDIFGSAVSPADVAPAEDEIAALLRERHHVMPFQEDDFNLRHPVDVAKASVESQRTMTVFLGTMASIALVVGGIGIMNIMLATVTERTREIGLRLAVGARGRDILAQFLAEALTLAVIGGGAGVMLGFIGSGEIAAFAKWRTVIGVDAVVLALGFAGAVGVVFGFYPARRASRLDPIEALRR
jgi:putative ABC transport system permease protein